MKLGKNIAEALTEGWRAFRATLSVESPKPYNTYYTNYEPSGNLQKGDIWITDPDKFVYIYNGRRWKELK
ncbi:hypothetical protein SEA_ATUIN_64 [Arthrobacter phage Atuin]|nr:hypothetical protein SEA_ATUIN_163 [Arthrobacter phage Atuin]